MIDKRQKQNREISHWPSTMKAERLLKTAQSERVPGLTPLLNLLMWAVEEAEALGLQPGQAPEILQELLAVELLSPKQAVMKLLRLDDPKEEIPALLKRATTKEQIAEAMLTLANESVDRSPFA